MERMWFCEDFQQTVQSRSTTTSIHSPNDVEKRLAHLALMKLRPHTQQTPWHKLLMLPSAPFRKQFNDMAVVGL